MPGNPQVHPPREQIARLESLIQEVDRFKDPALRDKTREIVQLLMDLHGGVLETILQRIAATGESGLRMIDDLAADEMVSGLLLLYGLHPLNLESRIRQALEKCKPYLHSHGGNVELLSVSDEGVVHLRLEGSCHGCPSSALTLKSTIEEAIYEKAPDVTGIEVEGADKEHADAHAGHNEGNGNGRIAFALPVMR